MAAMRLPAGEYFVGVNGGTASFRLDIDDSPPEMRADVYPRSGKGATLYTNQTDRFCLLFPDDFTLREDEASGVVGFYGPPLDDHSLEPVQVMLYVSFQKPTRGRMIDRIADERRAE